MAEGFKEGRMGHAILKTMQLNNKTNYTPLGVVFKEPPVRP